MANGKGSLRRPAAITPAEEAANWARIFNKPPRRFEYDREAFELPPGDYDYVDGPARPE